LLGRVGWGELKLISFVITKRKRMILCPLSAIAPALLYLHAVDPTQPPLERAKSKLFVDQVLAEAYT